MCQDANFTDPTNLYDFCKLKIDKTVLIIYVLARQKVKNLWAFSKMRGIKVASLCWGQPVCTCSTLV